MRVVVALVAMCAVAQAQEIAGTRGEELLAAMPDQGASLRTYLDGLIVGTGYGKYLPRDRVPDAVTADLQTLAPLSDEDIAAVGEALCGTRSGCAGQFVATVRCLTGACTAAFVEPDPMRYKEPACDPGIDHAGGGSTSLGFEWATGWQADSRPVDHRSWSLGFEARRLLSHHVGLVARIDRSSGRDRAEDANGDGRDDVATGAVQRVDLLAGPSLVFDIGYEDHNIRFAQLDLLGGYQWTLGRDGADGAVVGADLSYQLLIAKLGLRVTQGLGDASESRAVVAHLGFSFGGTPRVEYVTGCSYGKEPTRVPFALALDVPLFGYGLSSKIDFIVPAIGVAGAYHATSWFDLVGDANLIVAPNGDRDRSMYQALLVGARFDLGPREPQKSVRTGFFTTVEAGYAWAATTVPTTAGSGPISEVSVGWGGQGSDGMAYVRLHTRLGLLHDNEDARAIFLSAGMELRLTRSKWQDRI